MHANQTPLRFETVTTESLITRARNTLVDRFMLSDSTHLLFIDADEGFEPHQVQQLLDYDVEVVAGTVAKKAINWQRVHEIISSNQQIPAHHIPKLIVETCVNTLDQATYDQQPKVSGLIPVRHAGTGCLLIKRQALQKLEPHLPKYLDYGSEGTAEPQKRTLWFDTGIEQQSKLYMSEDYWFCDQWNRLGTTYVAPNVKLTHQGNYVYG
jgi:hypothetical protein